MRCNACHEDIRTVLIMAHERGLTPRGVSFYIDLGNGSVCIDDSEESRRVGLKRVEQRFR